MPEKDAQMIIGISFSIIPIGNRDTSLTSGYCRSGCGCVRTCSLTGVLTLDRHCWHTARKDFTTLLRATRSSYRCTCTQRPTELTPSAKQKSILNNRSSSQDLLPVPKKLSENHIIEPPEMKEKSIRIVLMLEETMNGRRKYKRKLQWDLLTVFFQ